MLNNYYLKASITVALGLLSFNLGSRNLIITPVALPESKDFFGRVNCIFQDKIGFIWIGKESGLFRYDGKEFKAFRYSPTDPSSISCNIVRSIAEDASGDLWIGTNGGGLNRYHRKTGKFTRYLHDDKNPNSISFDEVYTIVPDRKGNLWIGTDGGGLNYFDIATGRFQSFCAGQKPSNGLSSNKILAVSPAAAGNYWLATWGGGVHLFNPVNKKVDHIGTGTKYEKSNVLCVTEVKPGTIWIGTFDIGLIAYDIATKQFTTIVPRTGYDSFRNIQVTPGGEIFVASNNGLLYFPSATSRHSYLESVNSVIHTVTSIFMGQNQTLWVGTGTGWFGKVNSFRKQFRTVSHTLPFNESEVFGVCNDKKSNNTYLVVKDELIEFNSITNKYKSFHIPFPFTISLTEIPAMNALVCNSSKGLVIFDKRTGTVLPMKFNAKTPPQLFKQEVYALYPADSTGIWVAAKLTYKAVFDRKLKDWKITEVIPIGGDSGIENCHYPTCFLNHPNGDFWIGSVGGGLNRRPKGSAKFTSLMHNATNAQSISNNSLECMAVDRKGIIWIGTHAGLNRFDPATSSFKRLMVADGLADDWIWAIATDSKNRAWVSTRHGISVISEDFKTIKNYDVNDGLPADEFMTKSVTTDARGNLYFGSKRGLVWFHPDSIYDNPVLSTPVVVDFKINKKAVMVSDSSPLNQCIELAREIKLNHKQSSFSFKISALNYFNPQKCQVLYKLKGYDKDWQRAGTDLLANYTDVTPGNYIFLVKASNEDGLWNPNETEIKITITPPLWLKWYALLLYTMLLVGVFLIIANRAKKTKPAPLPNINNTSLNSRNFDFLQPLPVTKISPEQVFIQKAITIIEENIADPEFGVYQLANKMNISRPNIYRKIITIKGMSVVEFIKEVRLKKAAQLLLQNNGSISEVAYQVGYNDPKYFSKCFKHQFGVSPAQFIANQTSASSK